MKINKKLLHLILNFILTFVVLSVATSLNLNRIAQFIVIFVGIAGGFFLIEYFLNKRSK